MALWCITTLYGMPLGFGKSGCDLLWPLRAPLLVCFAQWQDKLYKLALHCTADILAEIAAVMNADFQPQAS